MGKTRNTATRTPQSAAVAPLPATPKNRSAVVVKASSEDSMDDAVARKLTRPEVCSAAVIEAWSHGTQDVNALVTELTAQVSAVNRGDMRRAEAMLLAQSQTLDLIFCNLMRRAMNQTTMHHWEAYMRMGMKAQSQCRATLQALADIKNPPVVFAKQANITSGPQQVNNGMTKPDQYAQAHAHAGESQFEQSKLLEDGHDGGSHLDTRTTPAATRGNQKVEAVGAVNRAAQSRGQGKGRA
jgi:CheY-like chemotaxis protein